MTPINRSIAVCLTVLAAACSVPVHADDGEHDGIGTAALRPVTVIDREDIALSGQHTLLELLDLHGTTNFFGLGRLLIAGGSRTVLLINGRRAGPLGDHDTIPLSLVERIEILDDNAVGALAGHAVSGAVNVVLREDPEGFETQATTTQPTEKGTESLSGSVVWRGAVGSGRMTLGVDSFRRGEIRRADRDYGRSSWREGGGFAHTVGVSPAGNTVIVNRDGLQPTKSDNTKRFRSIGDCRSEDGYTGTLRNPFGSTGEDDTGCGFAHGDRDWYTVRYNQAGVLATLTHPAGSAAEMFAEVRLLPESEALARFAPASGQFEFTPSDPGEFGGEDGDLFRVAHTFAAHGNRELRTDSREFRLSSGLRGRTAAGLGYEAHVTAYRYATDRAMDSLVSASAVRAAIESGDYGLENPLSSPEDVIRDTSLRLDREYRADYNEVRVALDGAGMALGGGTAQWTAGVELASEARHNRVAYRDRTGRTYPIDDVLGIRSAGDRAEYDGERRRASAFAELSLPVAADWDVALAGRGDDHDDVGGARSWRAATRYRLNDRIALRGSLGTGARPPDLASLNREVSRSTAWVCDSKSHGDSEEPCALRKVTHEVAANPGLDPEESSTSSIGAVVDFGRMSLSADWFRMELSRMPLAFPGSAQDILNLEAAGALPNGVGVTRNQADVPIVVRSSYGNTGREVISGLDVSLAGAWETDWADVGLKLHWLHRADYKAWHAGTRLPGHRPRNSAHGTLRAEWGDITASWSVHARSGYANSRGTGRFGSWIGHDVSVDVRNPFGLSGASLAAGVINVGNEGPSIDSANPNAIAIDLDSLRGRTFFLTLKARF